MINTCQQKSVYIYFIGDVENAVYLVETSNTNSFAKMSWGLCHTHLLVACIQVKQLISASRLNQIS